MEPHYGRTFYDEVAEGVPKSAAEVLPIVLDFVQPRSVIDVGCGTGGWLSAFEQRGADRILGIDGPWVNADQLEIPRERFQLADLTKPVEVEARFDLVLSLEVGEHLPASAAETFVRSLTKLGPVVLFSAAIPYQGGIHHVNERWPSYWVKLFAAEGFRAIDCVRPRLWHNPRVDWWYAQNMFFVVDTSQIGRWPKLAEAASRDSSTPLDLVHPRLFLQSTARAKGAMELAQATLGATRDLWLRRYEPRTARRTVEGLPTSARWPTS